jgi:predicted  nucleic acid-binding Zn-ribbon protein
MRRHPAIEPLLILQERDRARIALEAQLAAHPGDVAAVEGRIAAEQKAIEEAKQEVRELETRKKMLDTEIGVAADKLAKYRTQQMSVRKNDEFQALGHEIATMEGRIGELEGTELEVMYAIDAAKARFAAAEKTLQQNITGHRAKLAALAERRANLESELATVREQVAAARGPVGERYTRLYDRIAMRNMPVVVAIRGNTCGGCHLKVSSEIDAGARSGEEIVTCDQCGRIVWFDG